MAECRYCRYLRDVRDFCMSREYPGMQILSLFAWRERFLRVPGVLRNADLVAICVAREIFACPGNIAECRYRRYLRDARDFLHVPGVLWNADIVAFCVTREILACPACDSIANGACPLHPSAAVCES